MRAEQERREAVEQRMLRGWIRRNASIHPEKGYLEDARSQRRVTYGELWARCRWWEEELRTEGLAEGAPVALDCPDHLEYAATAVALLGAGQVVVPLDPLAPPDEVAQICRVARPLAFVHEPDRLSRSSSIGQIDANLDSGAVGRRLHLERPSHVEGPSLLEGPAGVLLCTSGTTGGRKGVLLREAQLAHVASEVAHHHELDPEELGLCPLPLFHINALVVGLLATLAAEGGLVVDDRFHRHGFWELVADRGVTWINAVPAIIAILASTAPPASLPSRVRFVRSASAPLPAATLHRFERHVGIPIVETYGMTEAASMITANPLHGTRKPGSVGLPVGVEVRVVDGDRRLAGDGVGDRRLAGDGVGDRRLAGDGVGDRRLPTGEIGRVQIWGPSVITSYASGGGPRVFSHDGWLDTRDLGYLDEDGYLFLVGRADDVINRGGEKLYPREAEEVLSSHPAVAAAAVVGHADPVLGARPVAFVVPWDEDGSDDDLASALRTHCAGRLSPSKVPAEIHLVSALPTGPGGKVARHRLRRGPALAPAGR